MLQGDFMRKIDLKINSCRECPFMKDCGEFGENFDIGCGHPDYDDDWNAPEKLDYWRTLNDVSKYCPLEKCT